MMNFIRQGYGKIKKEFENSFYSSCHALLYHRITKLKNDPQLLSVSPENFYEQIKFLKTKFYVLEIEEFLHIKNSRKENFPKNSFVITFDDGYADNYLEALPILESLN